MANFFSNLFKKKQEEEAPEEYYIKNPFPKPLNEQQLFGVSLALIISELNGAYVDSLETGATDFPQKQQMQRFWAIQNGIDALGFMDARLDDYGHRSIFNPLLDIYMAQECKDAAKINFAGTEFEDSWEEVVHHLENLDEVYEEDDYWFTELEDDFKVGTDAWDIGRVVFVARVCYSLGYITQSEAWDAINRAAKMARAKFNNWEDYAKSYMLGRAMWSGNDDAWESNSGIATDALDNKESPWRWLKW